MSNFSAQTAVFFQSILPQHFVSYLAGKLANCRTSWFKNFLIRWFINRYHVDLSPALRQNADDYVSFNDFFTRRLDMRFRPIADTADAIASPADGTLAQAGSINKNLLLQAKSYYFSLETLLGGDAELAQQFYDGEFATLYLAPHNYHRVHMPITGKLIKTIYVPGALFSVNRMTSELVPQLFSRNERLVCLFETEAGPVAVILVGALIVGGIQTRWMQQPARHYQPVVNVFSDGMTLQKGEELGFFCLGSTVILLFCHERARWQEHLKENLNLHVGEMIGSLQT